jgi:uncharacterized protein YndB with AHSA1/START domain
MKRYHRHIPCVTSDTFYSHPPERVWKALTDGKQLTKWLLPASGDIRPEVGHRFHFNAAPERGSRERIACEVVEAEPNRRLAYTWKTADQPPTLVTWTLEPTEGGTRLHLEHDGSVSLTNCLAGGALRLRACLGAAPPAVRYRRLRRAPLRTGDFRNRERTGEIVCR